MRFRNTLIMALILVLLGGFVYFYEIRVREAREAAEERAAKIVPFETEEVTRVTLETAGQRIVVGRTDDGWRLEEPVQDRADTVQVENLIDSLQRAEHERVVTEDAEDLAAYGLAEPEITAVLALEDGSERTVHIGGGTPVGYNVYARRADEPAVYITGASLKDDLDVEPFDLRDKSILTFEEGDIERLDVGRPGLDLRLVRDEAGSSEWRITRPLEARADGPTTTNLLNSLRSGEVEAFVTESPDPDALAGYGLQEPRLTVTLWSGDDASQTLEVGAESEDPAGFYARRRGSDPIFVVSEDTLADVPETATDIRNRSVVSAPRFRVRWLAVSRDDATIRLERQESTWRITEPRELETDSSAVSSLISGLNDLRARDFATEADARGLDDPYARIRIALDPEEPAGATDEPGQETQEGQEARAAQEAQAGQEAQEEQGEQQGAAGPEVLTLRFGATVQVDVPDDAGGDTTGTAATEGVAEEGAEDTEATASETETLRYVAVSGDPTVYLVPESDVDDLLPTLDDLRSKTLVSFTQAELSRLTVESGGTAWTVEKEGDAWSLVEPETRQIDAAAVTDLLWDLNYLRFRGVGVEWDDSPPDLSEYGLAPPALQIRAWVGDEQVADLAVGATVAEEALGDDATGEQVWVRPAADNGVFRVTAGVRESAEALLEALAGGD